MRHLQKTIQGTLQEEICRERLSVLMRAGEHLADAWDRLEKISCDMEAQADSSGGGDGAGGLDRKILEYNEQRERVRTRFYYLIVTREALGLIHHQRLEEMYRLPPKKRLLNPQTETQPSR